ncbi:unnamed protein product [Linum trigynum]|uniref:Uncharacterized protein n=1 Tax=Linum trigynum TaxID=586398 RepID=A0AAV2FI46_9ROSI
MAQHEAAELFSRNGREEKLRKGGGGTREDDVIGRAGLEGFADIDKYFPSRKRNQVPALVIDSNFAAQIYGGKAIVSYPKGRKPSG